MTVNYEDLSAAEKARTSKETFEAAQRQERLRYDKQQADAPKITGALTNAQLAAIRAEAQKLGRGLTPAEMEAVALKS
jgi:hypothetical protein